MKLGIIGTGKIVKEFIPAIQNVDGIEIVSLMSTPRSIDTCNALCTEFNIKNAVCDFNDLVKTDIDTVYVATPNYLHIDYCKLSLENGLNVICEKPLVSNYKEAKELYDLAMSKHVFLFEAISTLYLQNYKKIKEWLNRIGSVKVVTCQFNQYSSRYDNFQKGIIQPAFDPAKAGGALMDLNLYNIFFVLGLFGKPESYQYFANIEKGIDTSGSLMMKYDGFVANCTASKDSSGPAGVVIQGTKGCIKTYYPNNMVGKVYLELRDGTKEEFDDGLQDMIDQRKFWIRCISEFKAFEFMINQNDYDACYDMLNVSLDVSEVQTKARLDAGIVFPMDEE